MPFWRKEANYRINCKVGQHTEVYDWDFQFLMLFFISFFMSRIGIFILGKHVYPRVASWEKIPLRHLVRFGVQIRQLINIYCLRHIVGLVVLLVYYLSCVDRSGSLSGGAFNQLRLVTLNIVLTILY